jgi:uncharacterized protein (DUF58 family)
VSRSPGSGGSGRALALAATGAGAVAAALAFGTPVLMPLGIGLVLLALLAVAATSLAAAGARAERMVVPVRLPAGARARLAVRVRTSPLRAALLRALDRDLDPGTGDLPAQPLRRAEGAPRTGAVVSLGPLPRGVHDLPDPVLRVADVFGVAGRRRRLSAPVEVVALPPVVEIPAAFWERAGAGRQGAGPRAAPQGWYELDGVRDYQAGDPLARIHWGQTAKRGRLQTKELKGAEGRGAGVLVVLDCAAAEGVAEPFEVAVAAAASLVHHLAHRGEAVALELPAATRVAVGAGADAWPEAEDALARVRPDGARPASAALRAAVSQGPASRVVVLVTAAPDPALPGAIAAAAAARTRVALLLAGPRAAGAAEGCRRAGAVVGVAPGMGDLAAALAAHRPHEPAPSPVGAHA